MERVKAGGEPKSPGNMLISQSVAGGMDVFVHCSAPKLITEWRGSCKTFSAVAFIDN